MTEVSRMFTSFATYYREWGVERADDKCAVYLLVTDYTADVSPGPRFAGAQVLLRYGRAWPPVELHGDDARRLLAAHWPDGSDDPCDALESILPVSR